MTDRKKSTLRALEAYIDKQSKQIKPKKKNLKPESDFAKEITQALKDLGFLVCRVESRAVYSAYAGRYLNSQVDPGTSDLLLCSPTGIFCAVELKAPGRRSTLKPHQRDFLTQAISRGAFACVTDSTAHFFDLWNRWSQNPSKEVLLTDLPKDKSLSNAEASQLFD